MKQLEMQALADSDGPSPISLAQNFMKATLRWAKAGFPVVTEAEYRFRAERCGACKHWNPTDYRGLGKCTHKDCGCTKLKRFIKTETCPIGRWGT